MSREASASPCLEKPRGELTANDAFLPDHVYYETFRKMLPFSSSTKTIRSPILILSFVWTGLTRVILYFGPTLLVPNTFSTCNTSRQSLLCHKLLRLGEESDTSVKSSTKQRCHNISKTAGSI